MPVLQTFGNISTRGLRVASVSQLITFVGIGTTATQSSNSIGVPAGVQAGDLLRIVASSGGSETLSSTTGWTNIVSGNAGGLRLFEWWKVAGSSETANSFSGPQSRCRGVMLAYRFTNASPFDVANATWASGSGTSASTTSLTTTIANDLVCGFASTSNVVVSYTAPGSVNERYNVASDKSINGLCIWDEIQATAGASTSRSCTLSASASWQTFSSSFKQA